MFMWIDRAVVLAIHERQLAEHGGASGVRDEGLLDSALARPQQMLAYSETEPDLADLGASLAYGLARNHPFIDGNKRTAYVALRTFLVINGNGLAALPEERYQVFLAMAEGRLSASEFTTWLRAHLRTARVHEPGAPYIVRKKTSARKASRKET